MKQHFGPIIKKHRKDRKLTLEKFSKKLEENNVIMSPSAISRYESETTKKIPKHNEDAILQFLGLERDKLNPNKTEKLDLEIGIAYAIWSAPLILLLADYCHCDIPFRSNIQSKKLKMSFTAYGIYKNDSNEMHTEHTPFKFDTDTKKNLFDFKDSYNEHKEIASEIYTYTAKHLGELLNNDKLDLIAIAGKLAKPNNHMVVANFMNVANEGCNLAFFTGIEDGEEKQNLNNLIKESHKQIIGTLDELKKLMRNGKFLNFFWIKSFTKVAKNYRDFNRENLEYAIESILGNIVRRVNDETTKNSKISDIQGLILELENVDKSLFGDLIEECFRIPLAYAEKTIAHDHYDVYLKDGFSKEISPKHICFAAEGKWENLVQDIVFPLVDDKQNHQFCFHMPIMFFGWEPKISHFREIVLKVYKKSMKRGFKLNTRVYSQNFNLSESFTSKEKKYFTFDLVTNTSNNIDMDAVYQFVFLLKNYVHILNESIRALKKEENKIEEFRAMKTDNNASDQWSLVFEKVTADFEKELNQNKEIITISKFLNMTKKDCYNSLKKLQFTHWVNSDWMEKYLAYKSIEL